MKVSVLIPAYNVEKYISQCLESVCRQTHGDLQIVVIDDGSVDGTTEIIKDFAKKDIRIEYMSRENRGVAITRNELLEHAIGDAILFVDADDWIEADMISTLVSMMLRTSSDMVMCQSITYTSGQKVIPDKSDNQIRIWKNQEILEKFLEHRVLTGSLCNKLIHRKLFNGLRFVPEIGYGEDAMVMWDILNCIDKIAYTPQGFYNYRMNETSISHKELSESKMSALQVWDYISGSDYTKRVNLTEKAKARYGAEVALLLLSSVGDENTNSYKNMVKILREKLKKLYPYMKRNRELSVKFKIFAKLALLNWTLLRTAVKIVTKLNDINSKKIITENN